MTWINIHAVALHGILDLSDNSLTSSFDPENLFDLHDMIGGCFFTDDTYPHVKSENAGEYYRQHTIRVHYFFQPVPFYQKFLVSPFTPIKIFVKYVDDGTLDRRDTLQYNEFSKY